MNPGEFNRLITVQYLTSDDDGAGGTTNGNWITKYQFFAKVVPATASRRLNYNQIVTEGWSHVIITHFMGLNKMPTVRMRGVLDDGTIMLIHSVINVDYHNQLLELACYADPMEAKYIFPVDPPVGGSSDSGSYVGSDSGSERQI